MMDERMTESECTALCRRIDELCAENEQLRQENQSIGVAAYELGRKSMADENAKLRNQLHDQQDTAEHNFVRNAREYKRVCDENDRLRELVSDMWEACPADGYYCIYHCEHYDKESESHCKLEARMAELGVEVDDG